MTMFKCPNCGKHSNKFCNKCPDCGYERLQGKDVRIADGDITNKGKLERKKRIDNSKFRGGRNKTLIGGSNKHSSKRDDSKK